MEDREEKMEGKVGIKEAREMETERRNSVKHSDGMRDDFALLCVILCLLKDPLIFDMCLALFSASPSLASPSLWQLESGRALGVDTHWQQNIEMEKIGKITDLNIPSCDLILQYST